MTRDFSYPMTNVGAYALSDSPYGTFDQGGNAWEWNETLIRHFPRGIRGGNWNNTSVLLQALSRNYAFPANKNSMVAIGFRVASIPEPSTLLLWAAAAVSLLIRRRGFN